MENGNGTAGIATIPALLSIFVFSQDALVNTTGSGLNCDNTKSLGNLDT